jgi:hypothetical protein
MFIELSHIVIVVAYCDRMPKWWWLTPFLYVGIGIHLTPDNLALLGQVGNAILQGAYLVLRL